MTDSDAKAVLLGAVREELALTVGCTDPSAIGLACAAASNAYCSAQDCTFGGIAASLVSIDLELDSNLYKNAYSARIPGTGRKGIAFAAVLGALLHDHGAGLTLFMDSAPEAIEQAEVLSETLPVLVSVLDGHVGIHVRAMFHWSDGRVSSALVCTHHSHIAWIALDQQVLWAAVPTDASDSESGCAGGAKRDGERGGEGGVAGGAEGGAKVQLAREAWHDDPVHLEPERETLEWIITHAPMVCEADLGLLAEGHRVNSAIKPLDGTQDRSVRALQSMYPDGGVLLKARLGVAAATRARMEGELVEVMACGGSGNHGITLFLTLQSAWTLPGIKQDRTLLTGTLIGVYLLHLVKRETGILTPMCGCAVSSALAAAAAVAWGLGGGAVQTLQAMNIVMNTLGGIVCDGAKPDCAFKTALGAQTALEAALLACAGVVVAEGDGLGAASFARLLQILRRIHVEGMENFDATMVSILQGCGAGGEL